MLRRPKRLLFVLDVSGSMYRFNGADHRLERLMETALLIMEVALCLFFARCLLSVLSCCLSLLIRASRVSSTNTPSPSWAIAAIAPRSRLFHLVTIMRDSLSKCSNYRCSEQTHLRRRAKTD